MRRVSTRPPQKHGVKVKWKPNKGNMRKSAKNSNALMKELTMVQSDKTVKDTLAIDHKGKRRQAPKK